MIPFCYRHGLNHICEVDEVDVVDVQPSLFDAVNKMLVEAELTPFQQGMAGSALAGQKWTAEEAQLIDDAIMRAALELDEFTADDVWERADGVRVTKGLAGRLNAAQHRGVIRSTGRVTFAQRGGKHDHRQRLAVWASEVRS